MTHSVESFPIWRGRYIEVYQDSMELILVLLFSAKQLVETNCFHTGEVCSSIIHRNAALQICASTRLWNQLSDELERQCHPWKDYFYLSPFEVCTMLSERKEECCRLEICALLWSLLQRKINCPTKLYRYAYRHVQFLVRKQFAQHTYEPIYE